MNIPKFRTWDKENKKWTNYQICDDIILFYEKHTGAWKRDDKREKFELMQSTGLKDKSGAEIFEGDIIECWSEGVRAIGEVKLRIDGWWFMYPAWQHNIMWGLCPDDIGNTTVKIIGNIYENPELLEGVKQ